VNLVDAQKTFSKKAIGQLDVLEKQNLLLSLSDGLVSMHDLPSFNLRSQILKTKGCHLYAVDKSRPVPMLCVAIKKKLLILSYDGTEFNEVKVIS